VDRRIYYLLPKCDNIMNIYLKQELVRAGYRVTPAQLGLLFLLNDRDGQTMTELSRQMGIDKSGITRTVDNLVKSGHVERKSSPGDRREYRIAITGTGIEAVKEITRHIADINKKISGVLSQDELDALNSGLLKLCGLFRP